MHRKRSAQQQVTSERRKPGESDTGAARSRAAKGPIRGWSGRRDDDRGVLTPGTTGVVIGGSTCPSRRPRDQTIDEGRREETTIVRPGGRVPVRQGRPQAAKLAIEVLGALCGDRPRQRRGGYRACCRARWDIFRNIRKDRCDGSAQSARGFWRS